MLLRIPKALSPLRVDAQGPPRFSGAFRRYAIHTFTGYASDVAKRSDSYTTGSISSSGGNGDNNPVSVTGSIDTRVVVSDRFFLTDPRARSDPLRERDSKRWSGMTISCRWPG